MRLLASVAIVGLLAVPASAQTCSYIVEGTRWLYHADPPPPGWAALSTPDDPERTAWQIGCAPFSNNGCGFAPGTYWTDYTTLWLRQHVFLTGAETGLVASMAIDNDFELWVNDSLVSSLIHEGCATRWDSIVAVPDALWVRGDNIVAVKIVDRGGVTNFEMTLAGPSPGACPPGCAQLPCAEPGPVVTVPEGSACPGRWVSLPVDATWVPPCATELEYRVRAPDGRIVRGWDPLAAVNAEADGQNMTVEVRCAQSPTCPLGSAPALATSSWTNPEDPGPVLRVMKTFGAVAASWPLASLVAPGDHYHFLRSRQSDGNFARVNPESDANQWWIDPEAFGNRHYLLRIADACEIESVE